MPSTTEKNQVLERASAPNRQGAGGSPPGETPAPPPGIVERLPDGMREKLPDELVDELLAGAGSEEELVGRPGARECRGVARDQRCAYGRALVGDGDRAIPREPPLIDPHRRRSEARTLRPGWSKRSHGERGRSPEVRELTVDEASVVALA